LQDPLYIQKRRYDHAAIRSEREGRDSTLDLAAIAQPRWAAVRVLPLEAITGIPREVLRPDIYPPDERARKRARRI